MTQEEKRKLYAALAAPFPENAIQRTEGRVTGRGYDTTGIGYQFICNRLNEAVGLGGWRAHRTVTVKEVTTAKGRQAYEAICDLTLELGSWESGDFVVFAESLADGGHTSFSEADARKGAYTNALKKAAAMFGCGRQAYEGTLDDDNIPQEAPTEPARPAAAARPSQPPPAPAAQVRPIPSKPPVSPARPPLPTRSRLTSKQLAMIWAIGRKLGYDQSAIRQHIKATFGVQPEFLTGAQASQAITALQQTSASGHDTGEEGHEPGQAA